MKKNLIMITGAAARISQEVALIDQLINKKRLKITQDETMLAGFSSGSLNLLALNSCFRNENPLSWDKDYKENVLWKLTNDQVYKKGGVIGAIFNTAPLRVTLDKFLKLSGVKKFGDLPFESNILTFSDRHLKTEWALNFGPDNQDQLIASDLFMASTAIPIAFPAQKIEDTGDGDRNFPNGHFSDGGTGGQFKHFEEHIGTYVKANGPFESLNIISPMRQSGEEELAHLKNKNEGESFLKHEEEKLKVFTSSLSFNAFLKFLEALQDWQKTNGPIAAEVLVNIPRLEKNFGILDFNQEEEEYKAVYNWVEENPSDFAVPLDDFLTRNQGA